MKDKHLKYYISTNLYNRYVQPGDFTPYMVVNKNTGDVTAFFEGGCRNPYWKIKSVNRAIKNGYWREISEAEFAFLI
jgi:hypothetical protein